MGGYREELKKSIDNAIFSYSDRASFSYMDNGVVKTMSYKDVGIILKELLDEFNRYGLKPGDRVALFSFTSESYFALIIACVYAGIITVPIDISLPVDIKNRLIKQAKVKAVFATEDMISDLNISDKTVLVMERGCKYKTYRIGIENHEYDKSDDDTVAIIFSSGTTGTIKGVEISVKAVLLSHKMMVKHTEIVPKDVYLNALPLSHVAGFMSSFAILLSGADSCFIDAFTPSELLSAFKNYKPTIFETVPGVLELIKSKMLNVINSNVFFKLYYRGVSSIIYFFRKNFDINPKFLARPIYSKGLGPNMRCTGGGAAPFSQELIKFYMNLGIDLVSIYGSTECAFPITGFECKNKYEYKGVGSVFANKEVQIKINNPDENGVGEVYVKTELIMKGYFEDEALTNASFDDGWFKTGDAGCIDEDGILYLMGRLKENIVLPNGEKVTPLEIDEYYALENCKVAAVGVPSKDGCDAIHLFVETEDESMIELIKKKGISAPKNYKLTGIHLIEKIPVTTVGKIKRHELRGYINEEKRS